MNDSSSIFAARRSPAKSSQTFFFWWFRLATYFVIVSASFLFLRIIFEGSITVFRSSFPFINTSFFTQSPQTLYVFPWDDDALTQEQLAAVAQVEAEIREEIPEKEAYFAAAISEAKVKKAETKAAIKIASHKIHDLKKQRKKIEKRVDKATKAIQQLDKKQQRLFDQDADPETLASKREAILEALEQRKELFAEKAAVEKILGEQAALRNQLRSQLPENLSDESERVLENLQASLRWPMPGYFEEQNREEAEINQKYDAERLALETKYEAKISRKQGVMAKKSLQERRNDRVADVESEREEKLSKALSFEAGDVEFRGVYSRKVDAAGINPKTYSYSGGGIFPAIVGTVLLVLGSMTIALILGIFSAIYLSEYAKPGPFLNVIRLSILNLAGVPSIVFGLFGLGMFVLFFDWNVSLLAGCFTLAFMVLPVIITASEESLRSIPQGFREGSLALGATKWTSIRTNVLPYALPGILTSSVLGVARVAGETAPIMFTAAYALRDNLPWEGLDNPFDFFFQGVMALPYHIYVVSSKIPQNVYTERMQYGTAFVFLVIVAGIAFSSIMLRIRMRKKYKW